jgi:hypothetical protein
VVDCSFNEEVAIRCRLRDMRVAWVIDAEGVGLNAEVVMSKRSADKSCMQIGSLGVADLFIVFCLLPLEPASLRIRLLYIVYSDPLEQEVNGAL